MSNTNNVNIMLLNQEQCVKIIFWALLATMIRNVVTVDLAAIEKVISICSSNPMLKDEVSVLKIFLEISKYLTGKISPFINEEQT